MPEPTELGKLSEVTLDKTKRWLKNGDANSVPLRTLFIASQIGQLSGIIAEIEAGELDLNQTKVRFAYSKHIGDTFIHLLSLCALLKIDLGRVYDFACTENEREYSGRLRSVN